MTIEKSNLFISPNMKHDVWGNLFSANTRFTNGDLIELVVSCWEYRQRYYNDKIFCIPIPTTKDGKTAIHSAILEVKKTDLSTSIKMKSPLADDNSVFLQNVAMSLFPAKFGELIVADRSKDKPSFEILNFRGLPKMEVPPHPYEIARNFKADPCQYTYTFFDSMKSIEFWAHHVFCNK